MGRHLARMARVFLGVALAGVLLSGVAYLWLRTEAGNDWLLGRLLPEVQPTAGRIEVGRLRTDLWGHGQLEDVVLIDPEGVERVRIAEADVEVALQSLVGRVAPVRSLRIEGLDVQLDDPAVFGRMWPGSPEAVDVPWAGLPIDVLVDQFSVSGRVSVAGRTFADVALTGALTARKKQVSWSAVELTAALDGEPVRVTGAGMWSPDRTALEATTLQIGAEDGAGFNRIVLHGGLVGPGISVELDTIHLDLSALKRLVPELETVPVATPLDATGRVSGTLSEPQVALELATRGGPLVVSASAVPTERRWAVTVISTGLDTSPVVPTLEPLLFNGELSAVGRGWGWPDDLTADGTIAADATVRGEVLSARGPLHLEGGHLSLTRVSAGGYGARAQVSGTVDLLGSSAQLTVHEAAGSLRPLGVGGGARYVGEVSLGWTDRVTAGWAGKLGASNLSYRGLTVGEAEAEVLGKWDGTAASGTVAFAASSLQFEDRRAATARGTVELGETIAFEAVLAEPDREVAAVAGSYDPRDRRLRLDALRAEVAPGVLVTGEGVQRLRLLDAGVADADVHLRVGESSIGVTGGASLRDRDTLVVALESLELADLDPLLPGRLPGWRGRVNAHLGLVGSLEAPRWEGDLNVVGLGIPGQLDGLSLSLAFEGGAGRVQATGEVGTADTEVLTLAASLPVQLSASGVRWGDADPIDVTVRLAPTDTAPLARLLAGRPLPPGRLSAELRLVGSLAAPRAGLTASADVPLAEGGPTARAWLEASLDEGVGKLRLVLNQSFQSRLESNLTARVEGARAIRSLLGGDPPELASLFSDFAGVVMLKQLPVGTIRRVVPFPGDVDGALSGAFVLSGSPLAPRLQGGVNVVGARVGTLRVEPATLELLPLPLGYKFDASFGFADLPTAGTRGACARGPGEPAGNLRLSGFVPLDESFDLGRPGLALEVAGAGVPLAAAEAFVPALTETDGCIRVAGTVGGSLREPDVAVGLALQQGNTTVLPLGVRFEDIDLDGRFQAGRLVVDQFSARTDSGRPRIDQASSRLSGKAEVLLDRWVPTAVNGTVSLDHAWLIAKADRVLQVTGDLEVNGKGATFDVVGDIEVDEGFLNFPSRFFAADGEGGLHPDLSVVRPGAESAAVDRGERMGTALRVRPKVHINLARHMRISAALPLQGAYGDLARSLSTVRVDAELDGEVDLTRKAGALRLTGEVEATHGSAAVLGRPFDLTAGSIAFTGADITKPILDLTADYAVSCNGEPSLVRVAISGVPGEPELKFSGEGALSEEDAILRTLVLGSCPGESGTGAGSQDVLLGLVASMLANDLASSGQTLFQLDSLELDTSGNARVSVALGRNIFLTTAYDPLADPATQNSFSVQVELALPYRWVLSVETGDRGITALSSYRKFRF